jgi:Protein of unknown function (DUF1488)
MPLTRTSDHGEPDESRRAIAFWMAVEDPAQDERIRVFVTFEALRELDPSNVPDLFGAMEVFANYRLLIEEVASDKYDSEGEAADEDELEGRFVLFVRAEDFP